MFELVLWEDEGEKCVFYSCRDISESKDEDCITDRFYDQFSDHPTFSADVDLIDLVLERMERQGAKDKFFRQEASVDAIPPKPKILVELGITDLLTETHLRLYALRITENIVVLFDGEQKTTQNNQDKGSKVSMKWQDAQIKARHIQDALRSGMLIVEGRYLMNDQGNFEQIDIH